MRIDKWLWAARFYKTRSLANQAIEAGQVRLNSERCKPAKEVRIGDEILLRQSGLEWQIVVRALSDKRGPAAVAKMLYEETEASRLRREEQMSLQKLSGEPAREIKGRPTKRHRRMLARLDSIE